MKSRSPSKSSPGYINEQKLKIVIRIRPILNQQDYEQFVQLEDDNTLQIKRPGICTYMKFNNILPPNSSQKDMFALVEDSIKEFLSGINMTIFAYGQTGAGKTYSMIGNYSPKDSQENLFNFLSSKERGILSRSLQMIMSHVHKKKDSKVFVSFFEIYNEKIFDLYNNNMVPLDIRQSKNGQISIPDLMNVQIFNMEQAIQFLMAGLKNRATGSTHGNAQSSRSHSIFQINLQKQGQTGEMTYSSLRIVDLAGSEKFKIPSDLSPTQKQIRIQELTSINGSLSCLGHCISALIQKSRTHIPFRNSKLTRILSDALLGQGKMRFIICISPSLSASAQTFSTLQFANRAKKAIFQRSQMRTPNLSKKKSSQNEQISLLRKQLQKQKQIRLHLQTQFNNIVSERPQGLIKQNAYLRKQNQKLKQQLKQLMVKRDSQKNLNPQQSYGKTNQFQPTLIPNRDISGDDLKQEMLKLPIFQNKRSLDILEDKYLENSNRNQRSSKIDQVRSKEIKQSVPVNRKKAEFQKKIRRFIESDSPSKPVSSNSTNILTKEILQQKQRQRQRQKQQRISKQNHPQRDSLSSKASPSFNHNISNIKQHQNEKQINKPANYLPSNFNNLWAQMQQNIITQHQQTKNYANADQNPAIFISKPGHSSRLGKASAVSNHSYVQNHGGNHVPPQNGSIDDHFQTHSHLHSHSQQHSEQWIQNEDTQQLIQQACQKMNLPDFKDLKSQMDRARCQLQLLKQKDEQISKRKQYI